MELIMSINLRISDLSRILTGISVIAVLGSCASMTSDPALKSVLAKKDTVKVTERVENAKVAWLAHALLEPATRKYLVDVLAAEPIPKDWDVLDYSTAASMTGDLLAGSVNSGLGNALGATSLVVGLLAGDGSKAATSGYLLPANIDGTEITSAEQARTVAIANIKGKVQHLASNIEYGVSCVHDCNGFNPVYLFKVSTNRQQRFDYEPESFSITIRLDEFVAASNTKQLDSLAAGFPVAWRTIGHHGAMIEMRDKLKFDEQGELIILPARSQGLSVSVNGWDNHANTPFGRYVHRQLLDNTNHYMGNKTNSMFVYNGKVHYFTTNGYWNAFDRIIIN